MSMYHFVMAIMIYNQAITLKPPDGLFHQRAQTLQAAKWYLIPVQYNTIFITQYE